jgi:acyl carrier protein
LLLSHLVQESREPSGFARSRNIGVQARHDLLSAEPALRQKFFEDYAREKVSQVLGVPVSKLDAQASLLNFGLDSIMAIELKNSIDADLGVRVPIATFLQGHSIAQLTTQLLNQLTEPVPSELSSTEVVDETSWVEAEALSSREGNDITPTEAVKLLANIDQISDEEVHSTPSSLMAEKGYESP